MAVPVDEMIEILSSTFFDKKDEWLNLCSNIQDQINFLKSVREKINQNLLELETFQKENQKQIKNQKITLNEKQIETNRKTNDKICTICLDELNIDKCQALPCAHCFHENCVASWLKKHSTCPICKTSTKVPKKRRKHSIDIEEIIDLSELTYSPRSPEYHI